MTLNVSRMKLAEFDRVVWSVIPEAGTNLQTMLAPEYWAHVADRLRPWAKIEVISEDGSYYAELLVKDCGRTWAKVVPISFIKLDQLVQSEDPTNRDVVDGFEVAFKGPKRKWSVIRLKDGEYMRQEMGSREEAALWRTDHIKSLAR